MRRWISILWPAFIVGGVMNSLFFALLDPQDLVFNGHTLDWSRTAFYSVGFFIFWLFAAASSAFTCFLQRHPANKDDDA